MKKAQSFILEQAADRQDLLTQIHDLVIAGDASVTPVIKPMMGKEMIIYEDRGMMKYALSSVKNYMSLHVLPMYMNQPLTNKYQKLLPDAAFQKGCINFTSVQELPLTVVKKLIKDCAPIDLIKIRADYQRAKKEKDRAKKTK